MPVELADRKTETAYNDWLEQNHLEPMRSVWPDRYRAVVEQARSFILNAEDDDDQKEEKTGKLPRKAKTPEPKASYKGKGKGKAEGKGRS
jgi:hypothetical protein